MTERTMLLSRPRSVRIGGKDYPVRSLPADDMCDSRGRILYDGQEIRLSSAQSFDSERETMLHELLHAASFLTGGDVPERDINGMSKCLFGILRDNPDVVAWLMDRAQTEPANG